MVRVRQQAWTVHAVESYDGCRMLTLNRINSAGAQETRRILHPFDDVDVVVRRSAPLRVGMRRWRAACRALIEEDTPAAGLRVVAGAHIDLLPYQLEPALAVLHGLGSRVLIADDVGLGKTVQAMLAVAELRDRGIARRALIICPAGLREQWAGECAERFDMRPVIFDQQGIRRARARLAATVNPWTTEPLVIASTDFVKRPEVLPSVLAANWDLIVIDEAHGTCGDSDRHEAVARLAARSAHVILLTATPHNGDESAFASLCAIGQLDADPLVVFRRSRAEVGRDLGRRSHTLRVRAADPERRMHVALARLTAAVRRDASGSNPDAWLLLSLLHKRALSSAYALAASAERRLQMLPDDVMPSGQQLLLPLDDAGGELDAADAPPMWSAPVMEDRTRERQLFLDLLEAARAAQGIDSKIRRLRRLLAAVREPAIVFTEYRDTLLDLRRQLGRDVAIVHGGMSRDQRREALAHFKDVGILLATDAAGEGLNLQGHCRLVINLELPWNPMRLEQRIGRVDRIGQRRRVHVVHLIGSDTRETALLDRLSARVSQAHARMRAANPLCGRPEWTEDQSARLIVLREEAPAAARPAMSAPSVPLTRLSEESERESQRVALVRAIVRTGRSGKQCRGSTNAMSGRTVLSAVGRRRRLRAALGGRCLSIVRSSITDSSGRIVSTRVDGVLTPEPLKPGDAAAAAAIEALMQSSAFDAWHSTSIEAHTRMARVWARRAGSILDRLEGPREERQPGLFERRLEREWQELDQQQAASLASARARKAQADAAVQASLTGLELALLLVPLR